MFLKAEINGQKNVLEGRNERGLKLRSIQYCKKHHKGVVNVKIFGPRGRLIAERGPDDSRWKNYETAYNLYLTN